MPHEQADFDAALLDLHLGALSPAQAEAVRARIAVEPAYAAQHEALTGVFAALHAVPAPTARASLAERITAAIHARPALRVRSSGRSTAISEGGRGAPVRIAGLRDIIAIAAMVILSVGLGVPSFMQLRERSQRQACSFNLAQIGHAMQAYAATFGESLPFAGWRDGDSWKPGDPNTNMPNRRHVYLLARGHEAQPQWFVCPSSGGIPMPSSAVAANQDFLESRNLSYAYQNMAGQRPTRRDSADLPILADDNPCFNDGLPLFDMRQRLGLSDPARSNSPAHQGSGQNLLTNDGSVKWATTPFCGINGDNIWTLQNVNDYTGHEGPRTTTDSHLIK